MKTIRFKKWCCVVFLTLVLTVCLVALRRLSVLSLNEGGTVSGHESVVIEEVDGIVAPRQPQAEVHDVRAESRNSPLCMTVSGVSTSWSDSRAAFATSAVSALAECRTETSDDAARQASDLNDAMDEMLNRGEIPADYGEAMVALFRDKSQGDVIRDFAVQHIGLYAETLNMRGRYDADSREADMLRSALEDAADETGTIVAAAAFRALADMADFDPRIDVRRLDARLASCVADVAASPAARVMAAQLCGERRVASARAALAALAADSAQPEPLRLAAANSAELLAK